MTPTKTGSSQMQRGVSWAFIFIHTREEHFILFVSINILIRVGFQPSNIRSFTQEKAAKKMWSGGQHQANSSLAQRSTLSTMGIVRIKPREKIRRPRLFATWSCTHVLTFIGTTKDIAILTPLIQKSQIDGTNLRYSILPMSRGWVSSWFGIQVLGAWNPRNFQAKHTSWVYSDGDQASNGRSYRFLSYATHLASGCQSAAKQHLHDALFDIEKVIECFYGSF